MTLGSDLFFWTVVLPGLVGAVLLSLLGEARLIRIPLRLLLSALPVVFLMAVPGVAVLSADSLDLSLRQALIAGLAVATGWFVTFVFQEDARASDRVDLMIALRAEIWITLRTLRNADTPNYRDNLQQRLDEAAKRNEDYAPFITRPGPPLVFAELGRDIRLLPSEVVDPVIQFYSLMADLDRFAEDLRSAEFRSLELARRRPAYLDYYETRAALERYAEEAILALNRAMRIDNPARDLRLAGISSPAADRSGPGSAGDVSDRKP